VQSASSQHTADRARRRWRRVGTLAVLLLGLGAVAFGLFPQEPLRRLAERRLREALGPESRMGSLHVVPARLTAVVEDLVVEAPGYRLSVPRVEVRAHPALLLGSIALAALQAKSPDLAVKPVGPPAKSGPLPSVVVDRVDVDGGRLRYADSGLEAAVQGVEAHGAIGSGPLEITTGEIVVASGERSARAGPASARVRLSSDLRLEIESTEVRAGGSRAAAHGSVGRLESPDLDLAFDGLLRPQDARSLAGDLVPKAVLDAIDAPLTLEGKVRGPLAALQASVRFGGKAVGGNVEGSVEAATAAGGASPRVHAGIQVTGTDLARMLRTAGAASMPLAGSVSARAKADGDLRELAVHVDLDAQAAGRGLRHRTRASADGRVRPQAPSVDARWQARLDTTATSETAPVRSAVVTLEGTAKGSLPPVVDSRLSGRVEVRSPAGVESLQLAGVAHAGEEGATLRLGAESESLTVDASADVAAQAIRSLTVEAHARRLDAFLPAAEGRLDLSLTASGPFSAIDAEGQLRGEALEWNGVAVGPLSASATSEAGRGRVTFELPDWQASGEARVENGLVRGTARLQDTSLDPLSPLAPRPVSGRLSTNVTFEAPLDAPARASVKADVATLELASGALQARSRGPFTVALADGAVRVENAALEGPGVVVEADGEARVTGALALDTRFSVDLGRAPLPAPWSAAGTLEGQARIEGDTTRPRVSGRAKLAGLALSSGGGSPLLTGDAEVRLEGDRVVLAPADVHLAGGSLHVEGEAPLAVPTGGPGSRPAPSVDLRAEWSGIGVRELAQSFGQGGDEPIRGSLAGEMRLQGPLRPDAIGGSFTLRTEGLAAGDLAVELSPIQSALAKGRLVVEPFELGAAGGRLRTEAQVDVVRLTVEASSRGDVELGALSPLVGAASLGGRARVDLAVRGRAASPSGTGRVTLEDVSIRLREVPQAITEGSGEIQLDGSRLVVPRITARLGGGTLAVQGSARVSGAAGLDDVRFDVTGRELSVQYPGDFKSRLDGDLSLTGRTGDLVLGGDVRVVRGLYDKDIQIEDVLRVGGTTPPEEASPLPDIGLDLHVRTEGPILIRNNLGTLDVTGRLDVRGDVADPAPFGRLEIREGGEVYLQTRKFVVERGSLQYQGTLEPEISVRAKTVISEPGAGDVEVTVAADGPLLAPTLELTSEPSYSQKELASLIATGRRNVTMDSAGWVAGEQAAALLVGRLTSGLAQGFEPLGLDEVTIQPELLAREGDPSARFTFGKRVTPHFRIVYSIGLDDAEDRFFEGQYRFRLGRELNARVMRDGEGILTYGVGQRWQFGVPDRDRRRWRPRKVTLSEVRFEGGEPGTFARVINRKPGDQVADWDIQRDAQRLEQRLRREGHLEALVSASLDGEVATFSVRTGPRYVAEVRGLDAPPGLDDLVTSSLYEEEAVEKGRQRVLAAARDRGYLRARVDAKVEREEQAARLVFTVDPGRVVRQADVEFPGASALGKGDLLRAAGGPGALLTSFAEARKGILAAYHHAEYRTVEVDAPRVTDSPDGSSVHIEVAIREGPRARLSAVEVRGASGDAERLRKVAGLELGPIPTPDALTQAARRLRGDYLERGFPRVRVRPRLEPDGADVLAVFAVEEGEKSTVGPVRITGLRRTRESLVRRQVRLKPGDPLDPRRLGEVEKRLVDLGVFSRVVVTASDDEPAVVQIEVEEQGPLTATYDVRFSQEERATGLIDAEAGNLGGIGLGLGARYRVGRDLREARASLHLPSLGALGDTTASAFYTAEDFVLIHEGGLGPALPDTEEQRGFQLQQTIHSSRRINLLAGFIYKSISSRERDFHHNISGLQASVLREARDNPLDARNGSFVSVSLEGGGKLTGSDFDYARLFVQGFGARPVSRTLTWAQGYRFGLARGLQAQRDEQVAVFGRSTELFHAGGPNSLRGFALDSVGPPGPVPEVSPGGEVLLIMNQELRYRHPWGIGAAVFYDVGNVFRRVGDIRFELLHSVGVGLRYESPIGLLRLDVGFPLNPRPQDRSFQWFFSFGQAF
jgi:outer membrane protein insertion porin family